MRRLVYAALFVCLGHSCASAATLYAKIPGGNWSDASTWSTVGCNGGDSSGPPTRADDVLIEACARTITLDTTGLEALTVFIAPGATVVAASDGVGINITLYLDATGTAWSADADATINIGATHFAFGVTSGGQTITFAGGGHAYGSFTIAPVVTPNIVAFTGDNNLGSFLCVTTFGVASDQRILFPASGTTTFENIQTLSIASTKLCSMESSMAGTPTTFTKSSGTINAGSLKVTDVTATGGASWCASNASADGGGNTGWTWADCSAQPTLSLLGVR